MTITQKMIDDVLNNWNNNCNNIMDSQKKFNEEALSNSICRLNKLKEIV